MKTKRRGIGLLLTVVLVAGFGFGAKQNKNLPYVEQSDKGPVLVLPDYLQDYLATEFPGYRIPAESEFNPDMLAYYHSRLIGVHPAVAWGDFNGDKKQDFALLVVTSEGQWGPLVELVILNGEGKKGQYTSFRLGELYQFKDDYVSFDDNKLYKGRFKKNGWYINWDPKQKQYNVFKS